MKLFTIDGKFLSTGLSKVLKIRSSNSITPIVEMVKCDTLKGGMKLTCTNGDNCFITTGFKAVVEKDGQTVMIPQAAYSLLIQLKDEKAIEFSLEDKLLVIKFGENEMKFPKVDAKDFPATPTFTPKVALALQEGQRDTVKLLEAAKKYMGQDETRPVMSSVYFTNKVMVSTDGHRLMRIRHLSHDKAFEALVPKAAINSLTSLNFNNETLNIKIGDDLISIDDKTTQITAQLVSGKFPDYDKVIRKESPLHIELNREVLISNIRRAITLANKVDKKLIFNFHKTGYVLQGIDVDFEQEITLKGAGRFLKNENNQDFMIACFNGALFLQMLESLSEENVVLQLDKETTSANIEENGILHVLMPLLLNPPTKK